MKLPIIQIAGISGIDEALMIAKCGATHLGFPYGLDVNSEDTTEEEAAWIIQNLPSNIKPVLITYHNKATKIFALMNKLGCRIVQVHGQISVDELLNLKKIFPGVEVWKGLIVKPDNSGYLLETIKNTEPFSDAFITDTYDQETGASGATGKTHDWQISKNIVNISKKPVIIAGGLNPENVAEAVRQTRPAGVDVHTGVENMDGLKRKNLVKAFVNNAKKAFSEILL